MQAGYLQYGKVPLCKAAAKYGISSPQPPGALVSLHPLKAVFQIGQQLLSGAILKPQQYRPDGQGIAAQLIKNGGVGLVVSIQRQAKISHNGVAVFPQVFSNQAAQGKPVTGWHRQPGLITSACNQYLRFPLAEFSQQPSQDIPILCAELRLDLRSLDTGSGFKVVPYQQAGVVPQQPRQKLLLFLCRHCQSGSARQFVQQLVDDIFGGMDFLEIEPENITPQSAGLAQPAQEAFCQAGFSNSGLTVYQNSRLGLSKHGALQPLDITPSADKAVITVHPCILRQSYGFFA